MSTPDILRKIVEHKRQEVQAAMSATPLDELKARVADMVIPRRGFQRKLRDMAASGGTAVIAEVKKASPSKGIIRPDFDPVDIAAIYEQHGATCLSILTDEHFFMGDLRYLSLVRAQVSLPLLRKDFLFHPYQVYEASAGGADAILLIAAMLEMSQLQDLAALAAELHLDVLLEVHDEREMEMALQTDCGMIGINNRSLHTFVTDLSTTEQLAPMVPTDRLIVAESGINNRGDVLRLQKSGARAFLVGESLMRESDIGKKLSELLDNE